MSDVVVTRAGQITLTKDIREKLRISEGDTIIVNTMGDVILASKRDPRAFEKGDFLPEKFEKTLASLRKSPEERFKRLGIT